MFLGLFGSVDIKFTNEIVETTLTLKLDIILKNASSNTITLNFLTSKLSGFNIFETKK